MTSIPETVAFRHLADISDILVIGERKYLKTLHCFDRAEHE